mgnify:CR=1 FL=1
MYNRFILHKIIYNLDLSDILNLRLVDKKINNTIGFYFIKKNYENSIKLDDAYNFVFVDDDYTFDYSSIKKNINILIIYVHIDEFMKMTQDIKINILYTGHYVYSKEYDIKDIKKVICRSISSLYESDELDELHIFYDKRRKLSYIYINYLSKVKIVKFYNFKIKYKLEYKFVVGPNTKTYFINCIDDFINNLIISD